MNTATTSIRKEVKNDFENLCTSHSISFEQSSDNPRPGCIEYRLSVTDLEMFFELGLLHTIGFLDEQDFFTETLLFLQFDGS